MFCLKELFHAPSAKLEFLRLYLACVGMAGCATTPLWFSSANLGGAADVALGSVWLTMRGLLAYASAGLGFKRPMAEVLRRISAG